MRLGAILPLGVHDGAGFLPDNGHRVPVVPPMADEALPRVGVGLLIVDDDRVLLTLRRRAPEAGCWSILGGRVEFFETVESCAAREAREEAGIDISIERLLCVTDHILPDEGIHWVAPAFLGRIVQGVPANREPEKTAQVAWFALNDLPRELTLTARRAIHAYLADIHSSGGMQ